MPVLTNTLINGWVLGIGGNRRQEETNLEEGRSKDHRLKVCGHGQVRESGELGAA